MESGHNGRNQPSTPCLLRAAISPQWSPAITAGISVLATGFSPEPRQPQWSPAITAGIRIATKVGVSRTRVASMESGHNGRNQRTRGIADTAGLGDNGLNGVRP